MASYITIEYVNCRKDDIKFSICYNDNISLSSFSQDVASTWGKLM